MKATPYWEQCLRCIEKRAVVFLRMFIKNAWRSNLGKRKSQRSPSLNLNYNIKGKSCENIMNPTLFVTGK